MTSVNYIKDDSGTFIPSSQRPDGTWRRPIRVRDGYVPQEEQPLYVSKGKQPTGQRDYPVGMTSEDVASYRSSTNSSSNQGSRGTSSLYFDVGLYTPTPAAIPIPGLNFVQTPEAEKTSSKKKKSKSKSKQADTSTTTTSTDSSSAGKKPATNQASSGGTVPAPPAAATDPVKRLRNLRKRLKDIEALEKKIESGELQTPEKEQLEKINRKDDVLDEIDDLEKLIEKLDL